MGLATRTELFRYEVPLPLGNSREEEKLIGQEKAQAIGNELRQKSNRSSRYR